MENKRYIHIANTNYYLHIAAAGDKKTAHEKMLEFLTEKTNNNTQPKKNIETTGNYLGVLCKENQDAKSAEEFPTRTKFWHITDTKLSADKQTGCVLLKGAFSGLNDKSRIRFDRREIGSALLIPTIDKVREFTDDTVIYDHGKYTTYTIERFADKEDDPQKKIKYNFLNVNGQCIRRQDFLPVGFGNKPVIQIIGKPFYARDNEAIGGFVDDLKLLEDQGIYVYPPAYVYRGEHSCHCFPSPAALLLANAESDTPLVANSEIVELAHKNRQNQLEDIVEKVGKMFDANKISESTYFALMNQFNYEYNFADKYEKYLKDKSMGL